MSGMNNGPPETMAMPVARPPRRSKWRCWWPWLSALAIVLLVVLFIALAPIYRHAQLLEFVCELQKQGISTWIRHIEPDWIHPIAPYLPQSVKDSFDALESDVTLRGEKITANSVVECSKLPNIRSLSFVDTPNINDAALVSLAAMKSLRFVSLENTGVTGEGFPSLADLPGFERIGIRGRLTESGVERLLACGPVVINEAIRLDSVQLQGVEVTNVDGSKSIKEGDRIAIRGSFISSRFSPIKAHINWISVDSIDVSAASDVKSEANGIYSFRINPFVRGLRVGRHKIGVSVKLQIGSYVYGLADLGEVEFEVKPR
jgi:hypothetical protein